MNRRPNGWRELPIISFILVADGAGALRHPERVPI